MPPDVEVPIDFIDMVNHKNTPTAAKDITAGFPKTIRIGEVGYTSVVTVSAKGAEEIVATVPGAKVLEAKKA